MKTKRILSLVLALIMALALTVPAMAAKKDKGGNAQSDVTPVPVDKIEATDANGDPDPRLPLIEAGAEINTAAYTAIYIKQANDIAILVHADDARSDADIIAEAAASDKSLAKQDKGTTTVVRGDGEVWLHKNKTTQVVVAGGILTVLGPISHIDFTGAPAPEFPEEPGTTESVFAIQKVVVGGEKFAGFQFGIYNAAGEQVGTLVTEEDGTASTTIENLPAGEYSIKEIYLDLNVYEPNTQVLTATVAENGSVTFPVVDEEVQNTFTNYVLGKLTVNVDVVQEQIKQEHEVEYKWYGIDIEGSTVVSVVSDFANGANPIVKEAAQNDKNGFSYLIIDKAALEESENGLTVQIGYKDGKKGVYPCPAMKATGKTPTYTIKIVDDKLVATCDLDAFTVKVAETLDEKVFVPGEHYSSANHPAREIPDGETFCVFFHGQTEFKDGGQGAPYETNQPKGCKLVSTTTVATPVACDITVKNEAGEVVDYSKGLSAGTYTIIVNAKIGGEVVGTWTKEDVDLDWGDDITESFDKVVTGDPIIVCGYCKELKMVPLIPATSVEPEVEG